MSLRRQHMRTGVGIARDARSEARIYKRCDRADKIAGGAVWRRRDGGWYLDLMNEGRNIHAFRDQLLFGAPQTR